MPDFTRRSFLGILAAVVVAPCVALRPRAIFPAGSWVWIDLNSGRVTGPAEGPRAAYSFWHDYPRINTGSSDELRSDLLELHARCR
jgi:hypothetical protein